MQVIVLYTRPCLLAKMAYLSLVSLHFIFAFKHDRNAGDYDDTCSFK